MAISRAKQNNPAFKHGHALRGNKRPNIYRRWQHMIQRCHNPNDKDYPNYGGRGIEVCEAWRISFTEFLNDMGTPAGKSWTLDRIDNSGHYSRDNCRWATVKQQCNNTRRTVHLTINGVTRPLSEWSALVGVSRETIMFRIRHRGMSHADAVFTPLVWTKNKPTKEI